MKMRWLRITFFFRALDRKIIVKEKKEKKKKKKSVKMSSVVSIQKSHIPFKR